MVIQPIYNILFLPDVTYHFEKRAKITHLQESRKRHIPNH